MKFTLKLLAWVGVGLGNNLRDWTSCVVECTLKVLAWVGTEIHINNLDRRVYVVKVLAWVRVGSSINVLDSTSCVVRFNYFEILQEFSKSVSESHRLCPCVLSGWWLVASQLLAVSRMCHQLLAAGEGQYSNWGTWIATVNTPQHHKFVTCRWVNAVKSWVFSVTFSLHGFHSSWVIWWWFRLKCGLQEIQNCWRFVCQLTRFKSNSPVSIRPTCGSGLRLLQFVPQQACFWSLVSVQTIQQRAGMQESKQASACARSDHSLQYAEPQTDFFVRTTSKRCTSAKLQLWKEVQWVSSISRFIGPDCTVHSMLVLR